MFMWLLTQGRIQCRTNLHRKHVLPNATCEICNEHDETPEHIMGGCSIGRQFWQKIGLSSMTTTLMDAIHTLSPPAGVSSQEFSAFIALACWQLWKARNATVFRNETFSVNQVIAACRATAAQWRCRFPRAKRHIADSWCQLFDMVT
jgi:hypothetical protein